LLFPLFFLEFHFPFQEIGKTSSLISVKQAAGNTTEPPESCPETFKDDDTKSLSIMKNRINKIQSIIDDLKDDNSALRSQIFSVANNNDKNRQLELKKLKEKNDKIIRDCNNTKQKYETALSKGKTCEEKLEKAQKAKTNFSKDCSQFSGKLFQCSSAIKACANCADGVDYGGYDCVKIHNRTKCPALSGAELKASKEKRDKANEEIEKFQEKIKDLEGEIISKENNLNEALSKLDEEFTETNRKLERQVEELKADLEHQLKKNKAQIAKAVSESIAKVQAEIDNFLKVAHTFENALTKANMEYRKERRQIISECEVQAQGRLSQYRKKRRAAIQSGSLKMSLSSLLTKRRTTFGEQDALLIKKYYSQCLIKRKSNFQEIYNNHQQKLRIIEQQKEQYQAQLNKAKQKIINLNSQADQEQNKLLKEYTASMNKILASHQKETYALNLKYLKSKQALLAKTKAIDILRKHRTEHSLMLQEKQMELVHEQGLISYLKQMGVEEDSKESEFTQAAGSYSEYEGAVRMAYSSCSCAGNEKGGDFLSRKCSSMEKNFKILENLDLEEEDDISTRRNSRTSNRKGTR